MKTARAVITALLLAVLSGAAGAGAEILGRTQDQGLRTEWSVEQTKRGRTQISGYVYNERDQWAATVRLLVEALDATGQVTGSGIGYVYGDVPPRSRAYFEVPVPAQGASYRITIRTVDWRGYGTGG